MATLLFILPLVLIFMCNFILYLFKNFMLIAIIVQVIMDHYVILVIVSTHQLLETIFSQLNPLDFIII